MTCREREDGLVIVVHFFAGSRLTAFASLVFEPPNIQFSNPIKSPSMKNLFKIDRCASLYGLETKQACPQRFGRLVANLA